MRHTSVVLFACCAISLANAFQIDVEGGLPAAAGHRRPGLVPGAPRASTVAEKPASAVAGARAKVSKWYRAYQGFVAGAAKVSQLISFCCGVWLLFSSPFAVIFSVMTARFQEAFLCGFLGMLGVLLAMLELPVGAVQQVLKQYFFFAYTRPGRAALVVHVAALAWACAKVRSLCMKPSDVVAT